MLGIFRSEIYRPSASRIEKIFADNGIDTYGHDENKLDHPLELFEGIYAVGGETLHASNANSYFLRQGRFLIDGGNEDGAPAVAENLAQLGITDFSSLTVLLTHYHDDHARAARFWQAAGAQVLGSQVGSEEMKNGSEAFSGSFLYGKKPHELTVDGTIKASDILLKRAQAVSVFETPGHSPSDLSFVVEAKDHYGFRRRIGFVGDTFLGSYHPGILSDLDTWRESLALLDSLQLDTFLPGHIKYKFKKRKLLPLFSSEEDGKNLPISFKDMRTPWL